MNVLLIFLASSAGFGLTLLIGSYWLYRRLLFGQLDWLRHKKENADV